MRFSLLLFCMTLYAQTDLPGPVRALSNFVTPQPIASWNVAQTFYSGFVDAGSTGHNNVWKLPLNSVSGCLQDNGSYTLNITACPPGSPAGADKDVQVNSGGFFYADANFQYDHTAQQLQVTGMSGTASILAVTSFMQSDQGFLSKANNWQAFNSLTDGSLLRAYHLDHPDSSTGAPQYTGGYADIAMITYIPTGGAAYPPHDPRNCYDKFANLTSQPIPLNGLSSFGAGDILIWNSPSPLQGYLGGSPYHINGTPCGSPIPLPVYDGISNNTGLNTNAYILAMGGFATDINSAQALQIWRGGATAIEYFAAGFYPAGTVTTTGTISSASYLGGFMYMGHSTTPPGNGVGCTTIASCDNPLIPGLGLLQGQFYWNDAVHNPQVFDGTNWDNYALQATTVTFSGIIDTGTAYNSLQVPTGGLYTGLGVTVDQALYPHSDSTHPNNPASGYGGFGYVSGSNYWYWNGSGWATVDFSALGGGYWTLVGPDLYNNAGAHVIAGTTADDGSGFSLQSHSGVSVTGNIHATGSTGLSYITGQDLVVGNTGVIDYTGSAGRNLQVVSSLTNNWAALRLTANVLTGSGAGAYVEYASSDTAITTGDHRLGEDQWIRASDVTANHLTAHYDKFLTYDGTISLREAISGNSHSVLGPSNIVNEVFGVLDNSGSGNGYIQLGRNGTTLSQLTGIAGGDFAIDALSVANNVFYLYNSGAQAFTMALYQGKVGIGAPAPAWLLDARNNSNVNQIHISGSNSGAGGFIYASNGDNNINMSGGHYYNGTNWIAAAGTSGMISATGGGVFAYHNPSNTIGGVVPLNEVAGFTSTGNSLFAKTTIGTGSVNSQLNINSVNPSTDSGGFLSSTQDNGLFLSGGMEYTTNPTTPWIARSNSGATAVTLVGGSGISILINNSTTNGFNFTPTLTASFRVNSFNFTGHINGSLGVVSPTLSGGSCVLGSGSTDTRGSIVFNAPGTCNLNFASTYSTAPFCVGAPSNINSGTSVLLFGASTTQWSVNSGNTTTVYYICMQ